MPATYLGSVLLSTLGARHMPSTHTCPLGQCVPDAVLHSPTSVMRMNSVLPATGDKIGSRFISSVDPSVPANSTLSCGSAPLSVNTPNDPGSSYSPAGTS